MQYFEADAAFKEELHFVLEHQVFPARCRQRKHRRLIADPTNPPRMALPSCRLIPGPPAAPTTVLCVSPQSWIFGQDLLKSILLCCKNMVAAWGLRGKGNCWTVVVESLVPRWAAQVLGSKLGYQGSWAWCQHCGVVFYLTPSSAQVPEIHLAKGISITSVRGM